MVAWLCFWGPSGCLPDFGVPLFTTRLAYRARLLSATLWVLLSGCDHLMAGSDRPQPCFCVRELWIRSPDLAVLVPLCGVAFSSYQPREEMAIYRSTPSNRTWTGL